MGGAGRGGFSGGGMNMDDIFSQFGDIFGGGFGGFSGGGQRRRVSKGSNLRIRINLTLQDVVEGVDKKIKVRKLVLEGTSFSTCTNCNGTGQVTRKQHYSWSNANINYLSSRNGTGKKIEKRPPGSDQNGMIQKEETVEISIPAGVEDGMRN